MFYQRIKESWKNLSKELRQERLIEWRRSNAVVRVKEAAFTAPLICKISEASTPIVKSVPASSVNFNIFGVAKSTQSCP